MVWDPSKWEGIKHFVTSASYLWLPDITIYNGRVNIRLNFPRTSSNLHVLFCSKEVQPNTLHKSEPVYPTLVTIYSEGYIYLSQLQRVTYMCDNISAADFPFDRNTCNFRCGELDRRLVNIVNSVVVVVVVVVIIIIILQLRLLSPSEYGAEAETNGLR